MKLKFLLAAILAAVITLSGCSSDNSTADAGNNVSTDSEITTIENKTSEHSTEKTTNDDISDATTAEETTAATLVSSDRETIFRNACWGDTKEIIKSVETDELLDENENELMYDTYLSSNSSYLIYYVDEDYGLYRANYLVKKLSDGRIAHGAYTQIVEAVTSKYGEPLNDDKKILDSLYDYCSDDYQALELGYTAYTARWEYNDNTIITLLLTSLDYELKLYLKFETTSFEPPVNTNGL